MAISLKIGDRVPNLEGRSERGELIKLRDLLGKKNIVLYFYPKDFTSGCTKEALSFRDRKEAFEELNTVVMGISTDSPESHERFKEKYALDFTLVSDEGEEIAQTCGVLKGESQRAERTTFLVDKNGMVRYIWEKVKVEGHVEEVLAKIKELGLAK